MKVPPQLWNQPHWVLQGRWDCAVCFRNLLAVLPATTTLFVEGASAAPDVDAFLRSAAEPGDCLPARQTLWPRPKQHRVRCDGPTLAALAGLAECHAVPELLDRLFVYNRSEVPLEISDAFGRGCPAFVSGDVEERRIGSFAEMPGLDRARRGGAVE